MGKPQRRAVRVDDYEIEPHYVSFVEAELRRYTSRRRRLANLEDDLIRGTPAEDNTGMPRPSGVGNPTMNKAMALMNNGERAHLSMWLRMVDNVYNTLPVEQRAAIRVLYFENRFTMEGAAEHLHVDRKTLWRYRNRALLAFVTELIGDYVVKVAPNVPQIRHVNPL